MAILNDTAKIVKPLVGCDCGARFRRTLGQPKAYSLPCPRCKAPQHGVLDLQGKYAAHCPRCHWPDQR